MARTGWKSHGSCWLWVAVSWWKVFAICSDFEQSYKLVKCYVGILNPSIRFTPVLLNLKMNVCPFEAKWWWGVGDFFESVEKHMLSLSAQGWDWLVWFHLLKSSEIVLHLWNLNGLRCKGAELCSGQFSSMKCILWTQQTAPAPWETAKAGEIIFLSKVLCKKEKSQLNTLFFLKSSKRNGCATIFYEKIKSQRQCSYD